MNLIHSHEVHRFNALCQIKTLQTSPVLESLKAKCLQTTFADKVCEKRGE